MVDYTEKGWFIAYIDRDPETIRRQEAIKTKEKMAANDDERIAKYIEKQVERAKEKGSTSDEPVYTDLQRGEDGEKISLDLGTFKKPDNVIKKPV